MNTQNILEQLAEILKPGLRPENFLTEIEEAAANRAPGESREIEISGQYTISGRPQFITVD